MPIRTIRSRIFCRAAIALAALGVGYIVGSGRFVAYLRVFLERHPTQSAFEDALVTALIWIASTAPLCYASWELGREQRWEHREDLIGSSAFATGRHFWTDLRAGMASVFRIALRGARAGPRT